MSDQRPPHDPPQAPLPPEPAAFPQAYAQQPTPPGPYPPGPHAQQPYPYAHQPYPYAQQTYPYAQQPYPQGPYAHQSAPHGPYAPGPYAQAPGPNGAPAAPPPDISRYAAPKPRRSILVAVLLALALTGVAFVVALQGGVRPPATTPSPTAGSTTPATPGLPFTMPSDPQSSGTWQIVEREWTDSGVSVRVRVFANTGTVTYGFSAFAAGSVQTTSPTTGPRTPVLRSGVLRAGESVDGWVFLPIPRGAATLFLTTSAGRAYSALEVPA